MSLTTGHLVDEWSFLSTSTEPGERVSVGDARWFASTSDLTAVVAARPILRLAGSPAPPPGVCQFSHDLPPAVSIR